MAVIDDIYERGGAPAVASFLDHTASEADGFLSGNDSSGKASDWLETVHHGLWYASSLPIVSRLLQMYQLTDRYLKYKVQPKDQARIDTFTRLKDSLSGSVNESGSGAEHEPAVLHLDKLMRTFTPALGDSTIVQTSHDPAVLYSNIKSLDAYFRHLVQKKRETNQ